ncbi:MAG TPA: bifunctional riboflavin kinase/FAD synthetase [Candidatus Omnitrophota bacterium]|nr:bifunctional riboflavin kinase/FAD synthetase [Candidatus Omnitrophota bacterium]
MKVISAAGVDKLKFKKPFLAIGVFDGVHRGHQMLIRQVVRQARAAGGTSVVMTFDPHPVHVLHPEISCPLLVSVPHRLKLMKVLGVDVCIVIRFTKKFSHLTPEQFIQDYLVKGIHPQEAFLGDDFRFGQNRSGDLDFFQEAARQYGFKVNIISAVKFSKERISSTRIRKLISQGEVSAASRLLGRRVSVLGKVVKGDSRGAKLGFPTANLECECDPLIPRGVYLVYVTLDKKIFKAMANIGFRPSFYKRGGKALLEVHILDFKKNIYGREMIVEVIRKLRDEKKFLTQEALIAQIKVDETKARKYFQTQSSSLQK